MWSFFLSLSLYDSLSLYVLVIVVSSLTETIVINLMPMTSHPVYVYVMVIDIVYPLAEVLSKEGELAGNELYVYTVYTHLVS